jgi:hypothetical protein
VFAEDLTRESVEVDSQGPLDADYRCGGSPKALSAARRVPAPQLRRPSLAALKAFLEHRDDRLYVIRTAQRTGLGTVADVNGQASSSTGCPRMVFDEE